MDFTTVIKNESIDIWTIKNQSLCKYLDIDKDTEIDDKTATATIKWHIEIEAREWGIKGISILIDDVSIAGEVEYYDVSDLECEDKIYKEFSCEGFEVISNMEIDGDFICPDGVEIDFEKKTITVQ